ncbi:MAG: DUF362 domain-containing protein [Candidatus Zixiibacteriota bacterium]|nr:MAG: DUF362 domain-containing protein [candidate division Zixibacteria bacterium]
MSPSLSLAEPFPLPHLSATALVRCGAYDPADVRRALRRGLDLLGSPESLIRPGDRVLLKPNMLSAREPERAVTTHPEIITAIGEVVLDCRGKVVLGDSPGGAARHLERYWEKTGVELAARRLGVRPVSFEEAGIRSFPAPEGHISISRVALEADLIINLPKLKTHLLTRMTGAVKNMFGTVPGFRKGDIHSRAPSPLEFSRFVISIYRQVVPALTVMDAVTVMEGNGPSSGDPRHLGALLVSRDALTLDSYAARLIGMEPARLPMFQAAAETDLWSFDRPESPCLGDDLAELCLTDFRPPVVTRLERIPRFIHRGLRRMIWVRPKADPRRCTSCALCVQNCPENAMTFHRGVPRIDYKVCIKCGCCDELCSDRAIYQEMSILARLFS